MNDATFFGLSAGAAVVLIALALVFPQGEGARSPKPFGHVTTSDRAAYKKAHTPPPAPETVKPRPVF